VAVVHGIVPVTGVCLKGSIHVDENLALQEKGRGGGTYVK
jgi:hypothetical protein